MTGFLIGALLLIAVTLWLLLRSSARRNTLETTSHRELNVAIYRDQMVELERDLAGGELGQTDYAQARQELQRRVIEDGADDAVAPVTTAVAKRKTPLVLAILLPLAAIGLYLFIGNPAGINPPPPEKRFTADDIERMVAGLAAKLEKEPDNIKGWTMLARSYKAMGRLQEAAKVYERIGAAVEKDAQLLADQADLLASIAGGDLAGRPQQLLDKALKLDPDNIQALWLAGSAAMARKDFKLAVRHWERAQRQLPPESEDAKFLGEGIAEARKQLPGK